jgi:hypothetical protein
LLPCEEPGIVGCVKRFRYIVTMNNENDWAMGIENDMLLPSYSCSFLIFREAGKDRLRK